MEKELTSPAADTEQSAFFSTGDAISVRGHNGSRIAVGPLSIDRSTRSVRDAGCDIRLTTAEFDLLWILAANAGQVMSRDRIFMALRGFEYNGLERSVDIRVARLRRKLGDDARNPSRIKSIRSVGYLMAAE